MDQIRGRVTVFGERVRRGDNQKVLRTVAPKVRGWFG